MCRTHVLDALNDPMHWAVCAYHDLVGNLSIEAQKSLAYLEDSKQSYVAVFGKTQVGKTTLILDLLGIAAEHMDRVSTILRGDRPPGKSATATAMEYVCASDQQWRLTINGQTWQGDEANMILRLGQLRVDMEAEQHASEHPCVVHIPQHFFSPTHIETHNVRILDLPGDQPENAKEQAHVHQVATQYIPHANLILLVGRIDDLGFLRPNETMPLIIQNWQSMPHRFRIVTTYSYTAQSTRSLIKNHPEMDAMQMRRHLLEQIEISDHLQEACRNDKLYFPLEFGHSWAETQKTEVAFHDRMSKIIDALKFDLREATTASTSQLGHIRNMLDTLHAIRNIHEDAICACRDAIEALDQDTKDCCDDIAVLKDQLQQKKRKYKKIRDLLNQHSLEDCESMIIAASKNPVFSTSAPNMPARLEKLDRTDFQALIRDIERHLRSMSFNVSNLDNQPWWRRVRRNYTAPSPQDVQTILKDAFEEISAHLNSYLFDTYIVENSRRKDFDRIKGSYTEAQTELTNQLQKNWLNATEMTAMRIQNTASRINNEIMSLRHEYKKHIKHYRVLTAARKDQTETLQKLEYKARQDIKNCQKIDDIFDTTYLGSIQAEIENFRRAETAHEAWIHLISCALMKGQRDALMHTYRSKRND